MNKKKIILVTGATGAQGGSVARALLAENKFAVRILTRNASSQKAIALQAAGATIAVGDMNDPSSLKAAMQDCYGVFGVTNFWEHFDKEFQLGKNLVDAVHDAGIEHFIFSSLENYKLLSNGELPVPHYDMKALLQQYIKRLQLPASFVQISFYYENFLTFFALQKAGDGGFYFGFPQGNTKLASVSSEDYGGLVAAVFNHPATCKGMTLRAVGADITGAGYAAIISKVLGRNIQYYHVPRDVYASQDFAGAGELANMFEVQRLYIPDRFINLIETYGLNPATQTFEQWMIKNKARFETMMTAKQAISA